MDSQTVLKVLKDVDTRYGELRYINLKISIPPSFISENKILYNISILKK